MEYSNIIRLNPATCSVELLSWRSGGELLPGGALPVAVKGYNWLKDDKSISPEEFILLG